MKRVLAVVLAIHACSTTACGPGPAVVPTSPFEVLYDWVESTLEVTPVIPPGSNYKPGTVVAINTNGSLTTLGDADYCFGSLSLVETIDDIYVVQHFSGELAVPTSINFIGALLGGEVAAVTGSRAVSFRASIRQIKRVHVSVAELVDKASDASFNATCKEFMRSNPTVVEGFWIGKLEITFFDKRNVRVDLAAIPISEVLSIDIGANGRISSNGTVEWKTPVYVGTRAYDVRPMP